MTHIPIQVYGINLLVRLMSEAPADVRVHCPKGSPIRYGEVVELVLRGKDGRPTRRDEINIRLKPDGHVVMVQRWRIAERYDSKKL